MSSLGRSRPIDRGDAEGAEERGEERDLRGFESRGLEKKDNRKGRKERKEEKRKRNRSSRSSSLRSLRLFSSFESP